MSPDVYLTMPSDGASAESPRESIFVREGGQTVEISRDEWNQRHPDREPVTMKTQSGVGEVFSANITHNVGRMAAEAGIYKHLWRPDEIGITKARELIKPLANGLALMQNEPDRFKALNPENGWGSYDDFLPWIAKYLEACRMFPDADVSDPKWVIVARETYSLRFSMGHQDPVETLLVTLHGDEAALDDVRHRRMHRSIPGAGTYLSGRHKREI